MRNPLVLILVASAIGLAGAAHAQPAAAPQVTVTLGPALQKKSADYGPSEVQDLGRDLQDSVRKALGRARGPQPVKVDLVLEDAVPNRPTFAQLGRTVGLSFRSVGLGGARVSGLATFADGAQRPIREQFFETDLREDRGATPWFDADRAFDQVAYDLQHGKFPDRYQGPNSSGDGHFGYPFTNR